MKVLIADDHALFRDGLGMRLEQIDPNVVILQASSFGQALKILDQEKKIDLVVLDLDMPDMPWEEGLGEMRKKAECARFVVVSASEDDPKILNSALQLVLDGGTYIPPALIESGGAAQANGNGAKPKGKTLTNRQAQVLDLVAQGLSNKQIAYEMGVSEATVKLHINALLRSIGVTNRTQAVVTAQKMGLI